jgi:hypothetical protein
MQPHLLEGIAVNDNDFKELRRQKSQHGKH